MSNLTEDGLLSAVAAQCSTAGDRFTPMRRLVLELLLQRGSQASAYELIVDKARSGKKAASASVYRPLDFFIKIGIVKRIPSLNQYVVVSQPNAEHHSVFMVCATCELTVNVADAVLSLALRTAARASGFGIGGQQTEVSGVCKQCLEKDRKHNSDLG